MIHYLGLRCGSGVVSQNEQLGYVRTELRYSRLHGCLTNLKQIQKLQSSSKAAYTGPQESGRFDCSGSPLAPESLMPAGFR